MTDLDPAAQELLARTLPGADMPADRQRAIWDDIEQSIGRDAPPRIGEGPLPAAAGRRSYALLAAIGGALLAAGLVAGVAVSQVGTWRGEVEPNPDPQAAEMAVDPDADTSEVAEIRNPARPQPPEPEPEPEIEIEEDEPAPSRKKKHAPKADPREEMSLLLEARKAVNAGRYAAALTSVRLHEHTYPKSSFAQERRLLKVKALCGSGQTARARAIVKRHAKGHPALRNACQ